MLNFRDLSRALDLRQPFYGLQARGVDGVLRPHETIEEMARAYLEEIRALQPTGPYLLGGYSGGGSVAFEMAQQLELVGESVSLLAFIDTFHPQMHVRKVTMGMRFERLFDEGSAYLDEAVRGQLDRRRRRAQRAQVATLLAEGAPIPAELRDVHLTQSFEAASAKYHPKPWRGVITLFRAEDVAYVFRGGGSTYGWSDVVLGGIDIVRVPGNHDTLLLEPSATILVRSLSKALALAQHDDGSGAQREDGPSSPPHLRLLSGDAVRLARERSTYFRKSRRRDSNATCGAACGQEAARAACEASESDVPRAVKIESSGCPRKPRWRCGAAEGGAHASGCEADDGAIADGPRHVACTVARG